MHASYDNDKNVELTHFDCCRMVSLRAGESGMAALVVHATMLMYHIAIVSITVGSTSFLYLYTKGLVIPVKIKVMQG